MTSSFFHEVAAVAEVECVNGFVAAKVSGVVVAVFNERTGTFQVFDDAVFSAVFPAHAFGARRVRVTKGNDARPVFF